MATSTQLPIRKAHSYAPLYWVLAVCIAPTVAAFIAFYGIDWHAKANIKTTNYGELLANPTPLPMLLAAQQQISPKEFIPFSNKILNKKWIYLTVGSGVCDEFCAKRLFTTRQLRAIAGRERDRIIRVWLVTDQAPIDVRLFAAHPDLVIVRLNSKNSIINSPVNNTSATPFLKPASGTRVSQHIWVLDPLTRPMMRFPVNYQPELMKKDLSRLLYASKSWQY
jgi:hypothetical protein